MGLIICVTLRMQKRKINKSTSWKNGDDLVMAERGHASPEEQ